jgi:hypothetical protein
MGQRFKRQTIKRLMQSSWIFVEISDQSPPYRPARVLTGRVKQCLRPVGPSGYQEVVESSESPNACLMR